MTEAAPRACSPSPFASAAESGPRSTVHRLRPEPDTRAHARTRELESELNPSRQATPWTPWQPHASQDPGKSYRSLFDPFRRPCVSAGRFGSRRGARAAAVFSARFSHRKSTPNRATFSPRNPTRIRTRLTNRGDLQIAEPKQRSTLEFALSPQPAEEAPSPFNPTIPTTD